MRPKKRACVIISYTSVTALLCFFIYMLLGYPETGGEGVRKGIDLCLYTLMPSMYPFMVISTFIISGTLAEKCESVFSFVTRKILRLPGICGVIIILSMTGGLPIGARATENAYDRGLISRTQGQRLLTFCVNPGPAFVITGVGFYFLNSRSAGAVIYASLVLSSMIIGLLTGFVFQDESGLIYDKRKKEKSTVTFSTALVTAVSDAIRGIINVSAWVILFSCIIELIGILPLSEGMNLFVSGVAEMTNGVKLAAGRVPIPVISGIIGFTGICGQMQIMPTVIKLKLPIKYFLTARVINAALAMVITKLLLDIVPVSVQTITLGHLPERLDSEFSLPVCIGVLLMSILLLLGDNYHISKRVLSGYKKTL